MDQRLVEFIEQVAQTIVGLDVALFFQSNPRTFDTAAGIALRTHRDAGEVAQVLERLALHGYLAEFQRGDGRYHCYALPKDAKVWNLLCRLSEAYMDDADTRKEIVRLIVHYQTSPHASGSETEVRKGSNS